MEVVRTGRRTLERVDALQREQEVRHRGRKGGRARYFQRRRLTLDPAVDRPRPWIALSRLPASERRGNRDRQPARQQWQPALLLVYLRGIRPRRRQAHEHLGAEPERPVV